MSVPNPSVELSTLPFKTKKAHRIMGNFRSLSRVMIALYSMGQKSQGSQRPSSTLFELTATADNVKLQPAQPRDLERLIS